MPPGEQLRVLVLGRYSPAKGLETVLRAGALAGARVEAHGSDETFEDYKRGLAREFPDADLGGPVPRSLARAHCHSLAACRRAAGLPASGARGSPPLRRRGRLDPSRHPIAPDEATLRGLG